MEMTAMMKRYEEKTGKPAIHWTAFGFEISQEYLDVIEAKANISDEAIKAFQKIIRNQCDEISELKDQLTWRPVSEELPEKEKPVYPKPWRNRRYNPYIVTDGHEARFAFFAEVSKDKWWFVNPHNHHEIKNVVAWKDASLGLPIPPAPEGEYKMEKTGQMIEFEEETGQTLEDAKERGKIFDFYSKCIQWLETELLKASVKATAYGRLMSGGKKTLKEWANLLGKPIAVDAEGSLLWFPKKPEIGLVTWIWYDEQFGCFGEYLPKNLIDYTGNWKDSLTLPDEWEEK